MNYPDQTTHDSTKQEDIFSECLREAIWALKVLLPETEEDQ